MIINVEVTLAMWVSIQDLKKPLNTELRVPYWEVVGFCMVLSKPYWVEELVAVCIGFYDGLHRSPGRSEFFIYRP